MDHLWIDSPRPKMVMMIMANMDEHQKQQQQQEQQQGNLPLVPARTRSLARPNQVNPKGMAIINLTNQRLQRQNGPKNYYQSRPVRIVNDPNHPLPIMAARMHPSLMIMPPEPSKRGAAASAATTRMTSIPSNRTILPDIDEEPRIIEIPVPPRPNIHQQPSSTANRNFLNINHGHYPRDRRQSMWSVFSDYSEISFRGKRYNIRKVISSFMDRFRIEDPRKKFKIFGILFLFGLLLNEAIFDPINKSVLQSMLELNPDTMFMRFVWIQPKPVTLYVDFYLYDIRNPEQFMNGARPNVKEIGPFVYEFKRTRKVLKWTNDTVVFTERFEVEYLPSLTNVNFHQKITVVNTLIVGGISVAYYYLEKLFIKFLNTIVHNVVTLSLQVFGESIIETRTVEEILEGRTVTLLRFMNSIVEPLRSLGIPFPDYNKLFNNFGNYHLANFTFSIVHLISGQDFGPFEVYRFARSGHKVHQFYKVLDSRILENYKPTCNSVDGLDILQFGINDQGQSFDTFFQHFCRLVPFERNITHYIRGVRSVRYQIPPNIFDMRVKKNQCFCFGDRSLAQCDGYTDISGCFGGLPLAMSFPHYYGSRILQSQIYGLPADWRKHHSYMEIEPLSGLPFELNIQMQYSLMLKNFPKLGQLGRIRAGMVPFFALRAVCSRVRTEYAIHALLVVASFLLNNGRIMLSTGSVFLATYCFYRGFTYRPKSKLPESIALPFQVCTVVVISIYAFYLIICHYIPLYEYKNLFTFDLKTKSFE